MYSDFFFSLLPSKNTKFVGYFAIAQKIGLNDYRFVSFVLIRIIIGGLLPTANR